MYLLDKADFSKAIGSLRTVAINTLFARFVIERKVSGKIYVDDLNNPATYYVIHPYGMSLLFGDCKNETFNNAFAEYALNKNKPRNAFEWMQAFPYEWNDKLAMLFGDNLVGSKTNTNESGVIELNTRVNFKFVLEKYLNREIKTMSNIEIIRTNEKTFNSMNGTVVPKHFWDNSDDFANNGIGFSLFCNKQLAATAYSAYRHEDKLELGIETVAEFRKQGFAEMVCSALIDYCIENKYEPVWACRLENTGSYILAQKLGFEPTIKIPYYRLSK
jgi:GNAT superfamily N-acetyltransferase